MRITAMGLSLRPPLTESWEESEPAELCDKIIYNKFNFDIIKIKLCNVTQMVIRLYLSD